MVISDIVRSPSYCALPRPYQTPRADCGTIRAPSQTCPWCYIGQRELQKAIKEVADCGLTIKVEHRPFLLHPTMEEDKVTDRATFYHEKFGEEKLKQIKQMVTSRAEDVGVEM